MRHQSPVGDGAHCDDPIKKQIIRRHRDWGMPKRRGQSPRGASMIVKFSTEQKILIASIFLLRINHLALPDAPGFTSRRGVPVAILLHFIFTTIQRVTGNAASHSFPPQRGQGWRKGVTIFHQMDSLESKCFCSGEILIFLNKVSYPLRKI